MTDQSRPDLSALRLDPSARRNGDGRPRRRWVWVCLGVAVFLPALMIIFGMGRPVEVEVVGARALKAGEPEAVLQASGYVTPRRKATLAAKITGRVKEVLVDEGMAVTEGQVLAILDDAEALASCRSAQGDRDAAKAAVPDLEAQLAEATRNLERVEALAKEGVVDPQSLDRARTQAEGMKARLHAAREQVQAAEGRLASARQFLESCTVRAPFAGIAVSKDAQPGEMVSPISAGGGFTRTGIATVVDMASLEIEVDVSEASIAKVTPGMQVEAALDAYPEWKLPCRVRTVIPTADRQKATVKVRISFDALDPKILPDMGVKVAFLSDPQPLAAGESPAKCSIPTAAVREENGQKVAFVLKEGRLSLRVLKLGAPRGADSGIISGVEPGEAVVVGGPSSMKDGQKAHQKGG